MNGVPGTLPGPRGVGAALTTVRFFERPLDSFEVMRSKYGDISQLNVMGDRLVVLCDPAMIETVLVEKAAIMQKDSVLRDLKVLLGEGLLTSEGEFWKKQRRAIAPAFQRRHVNAYADTMVRLTREHLQEWQHGEHGDVHERMMRLTLKIVVQTLFDSDVTESEHIVGEAVEQAMLHMDRELHTFRSLVPSKVQTPGRRQFRETVRTLDKVVLNMIRARRERGDYDNGDLLGRMIAATDDVGNTMDDQQLRDEVLTLFLAGHETTALTLTWTWMLLSRHPEVAHRLRQELRDVVGDRDMVADDMMRLPYTNAVLKESMRLYPPAWIMGRENLEELTLGGYRVPVKSQLLCPTWVLHRDPRWFDRPLRFEPQRWLDGLAERLPRFAYFPFGGGPRICIGNHFAMMEAVLLLGTMVRDWSFQVDPGYRPVLVPSITLRPRHGMPGVFHKAASR